ncbi:MAG: alpha/beta hydrolase [candidate division NC10 bacterium]|nr:alpha/beta hydrolase [candidate division NC10 bacterium]
MRARLLQWVALLLLAMTWGGCSTNLERGGTTRVQPTPVAETALSRKFELRLINSRGEHLEYFIREPRDVKRPLPAVFILAGVETGRESLDLIDDRDDLVLVSMNYPRREELALSGLGLVLAPYVLRRMAFDSLEGGRLALDYLSRRTDVDQKRIILLGVSFGSPIIVALGARDPRADAVVLIYGGGDLGGLARSNLRERPWWVPGWIIPPAVRAFLGEFEPLAHVEKVAPRYFLMVSSRQDEMFPPSSALALYGRARDPKKLIWYETGHLDLFDRQLIRRLTRDVVADLRAAGYLH